MLDKPEKEVDLVSDTLVIVTPWYQSQQIWMDAADFPFQYKEAGFWLNWRNTYTTVRRQEIILNLLNFKALNLFHINRNNSELIVWKATDCFFMKKIDLIDIFLK